MVEPRECNSSVSVYLQEPLKDEEEVHSEEEAEEQEEDSHFGVVLDSLSDKEETWLPDQVPMFNS